MTLKEEFRFGWVVTNFFITLIVTHVAVLGITQWTQNSVGGRIACTIVAILWILIIYGQTLYAVSWFITRSIKGYQMMWSFFLSTLSVMFMHANIFFVTALYGESYTLLPLITQAYNAYYRGMFPMAVGTFLTAGNASTTPVGVMGHLWWSWTAMVGWLHIGFIVSFVMAHLTRYWYKVDMMNQAIPMEYVNHVALSRINQHNQSKQSQYSTRRRNRIPTPTQLPMSMLE